MYNSPIQFCPACRQHVALDQTKEECAREHNCKVDACPLAHLFAPTANPPAVTSESRVKASADRRR